MTADALTEDSEKVVEFGIGGICNACLGKTDRQTDIAFDFSLHLIYCWTGNQTVSQTDKN